LFSGFKPVGHLAETDRNTTKTLYMNPIPRLQSYSGPVIFSYGFRPFFFLGALYAGLAIAIWLPVVFGEFTLPTVFAPQEWHIHEMLYGYLPAVMTGFLLTAIPNWTGRLPVQGRPLVLLVLVWISGRIAVVFSNHTGWLTAAVLDSSFLFLVAFVVAREIIRGRNWPNLKVLAPVTILGLADVAFHIEAHFGGADYSIRLGIATFLFLLTLIAGRIIPSFTHNWLSRQAEGRMPVSFSRFDLTVVIVTGIALAIWIIWPATIATAAALVLSGLLHAIRLARWAGERTLRERLVLVLHVAYAFLPVGFIMVGLAAADILPISAGLHAWMAGAAGLMTVAVMTRATLGHTGRPLIASVATQAIYVAVLLAALFRIAAALEPGWNQLLLYIAGCAWMAGFFGFALFYAPALWRTRRERRPTRG
jgi:uncharacterized protein involved in response to NO